MARVSEVTEVRGNNVENAVKMDAVECLSSVEVTTGLSVVLSAVKLG